MTTKEFKEVYKIAQNREYPKVQEFFRQAEDAMMGFGVNKVRIYVTKQQAAYILNYQCRMFNGMFDMGELNTTMYLYKKWVCLLD